MLPSRLGSQLTKVRAASARWGSRPGPGGRGEAEGQQEEADGNALAWDEGPIVRQELNTPVPFYRRVRPVESGLSTEGCPLAHGPRLCPGAASSATSGAFGQT